MHLVEVVHEFLATLIQKEDLAIDATIGNGHDTLFLAKCGAIVSGFDIQDQAIENTQNRLSQGGYSSQVSLYKASHELMIERLPKVWIGNVQIVMFNLGYLPGGDKTVITRAESTLQALAIAYSLLKKEGYLSIVLYPDHKGGEIEASGVKKWIVDLVDPIQHVRPAKQGPEWYLIRKN